MAKALRESDEPELKLINASATEVEDVAIMPLDRARKANKE